MCNAADGAGGALLITGEPGMGKTRLVEAACDLAAASGVSPRIGRCEQLEVERALSGPLRAFDRDVATTSWRSTGSRTLLGASAGAAEASSLADGLLEIAESECARTPLLLAIEDLHWADLTTVFWVRAVAKRAGDLPLALVLTTRPVPMGTDVHRALAGLAVPRLDLAPLGQEDARALARTALEFAPTQQIAEAVESAAGNPLLVLAILDAIKAGASGAADGVVALVRELNQSTLRTLQMAAILGREIDPVLLSAMTGMRTIELLADLEAGTAAGIVLATAQGFTFRHELHRDAVLAAVVPAAQASLHLEAARVLTTAGASPLAVAEHYARGARPGDQKAVIWLHYAAQEIVGTAPEAALRLCDVAIAAGTEQPPPELLLTKVRALAGAGRASEADALGRALLRSPLAPAVQARLHRELAFTAFMQGRADVAAAEMEQCAALTEDTRLRAQVQGEVAFARFLVIDHPGARDAGERAVTEGRHINDNAAQVAGGAVLCFLDLFQMRLDQAGDRAREIVELADQPDNNDSHPFQPWFIASLVHLESDQFDELAMTSRRGREQAIRYGSAWAVPAYDAISAFGSLRIGELDDAAAAAEAALSYSDGVDGFGVAVWCNAFLAQIALHRGADDVAAERISAAQQWLAKGRAQLGFEQLCLAVAELHEHRGELDKAYSVLAEVWDVFVASGVRSPLPGFGAPLARLASQTGHSDRSVDVAEVLVGLATDARTVRARLVAELAAAWRDADPDRATRAAELGESTALKPLTAAALTDAAILLRLRGRAKEADRLADAATNRWMAMGADASAATCAAMNHKAMPATPRPRFGIDALTRTERQVVRLVAEGKTNAEIANVLGISRRTVESHVSATYRKLEVTTRVSMTRVALNHSL